MADEMKFEKGVLELTKGDITAMEIESFGFYAQHDLALGSGHGTAIAVRGGPSIQEELNGLAPLKTTEAVVSSAGEMKATHIIHSVSSLP